MLICRAGSDAILENATGGGEALVAGAPAALRWPPIAPAVGLPIDEPGSCDPPGDTISVRPVTASSPPTRKQAHAVSGGAMRYHASKAGSSWGPHEG